MEKINWKYIGFMVAVTLFTVFIVFGIPEAKAEPAVINLTEIHAEIEDIEENMQIIIENWDTGSRKNPLKDLEIEINRLIKINYKLGKLIKEHE